MLLAEHPEIQHTLFQEVDQIIYTGGEGEAATANISNVDHLHFTKCCIYEALRLYPTVPSFPRLSVHDTKLQGFDIPQGSLIFVSQSAMNRRTDIWGSNANGTLICLWM